MEARYTHRVRVPPSVPDRSAPWGGGRGPCYPIVRYPIRAKDETLARKTITKLVDDLDGSAAAQTVEFGWEGRRYEIDLSKKNVAAFERAMKPYLAGARSVSAARGRGAATRRRGRGAVASRASLQDVRSWAREHGYEVSDRGRLPSSVLEAYEAAK